MRTLTPSEVHAVSGGLTPPKIHPLTNWRIAMLTFEGWAFAAWAAGAGYGIGTLAYNHSSYVQYGAAGLMDAGLGGILDDIANLFGRI